MRPSSHPLAPLAATAVACLALLPACARSAQVASPPPVPPPSAAADQANPPVATTPTPVARAEDARTGVRRLVDSLVARPEWRNAHWGILIVDPQVGDTLYALNAGKLFMPASNQKLLTAAVALARLGPDYRFRTEFAARGDGRSPTVSGGVLRGDLVVTGYGDPTVSDHARDDAMIPLREIADSLAARGIERISGKLVVGEDIFPDPELGFGWAWDDLDYAYSAGVDELFFNEGFTRIVLHGGARAGDPVTAYTAPARSYPALQVEAVTAAAGDTTAADAEATTLPDGRVVVTGTVPTRDSVVIQITFRKQAPAYLAALREALAERGIEVDGNPPGGATPASPPIVPLFTTYSAPLGEIMPLLQKPSQNQIAEIFLRTVGRELTGSGSADSGQVVVERQLQAWGAAPDGFVVRDGSGLSRHDYVSPATIVTVLDVMTRDPAFQVYYDALPIAGVDGTIENRMRGTPAQGNVHAKTGYIDRARSLSGYVTTADGHRLLFSILANNWTTRVRQVEDVQDAIAARLASMTLGGTTTTSGGR